MERTIYRKPNVIEITRGWDFNFKINQYHAEYTLILSLFYLTFYISLPEGVFGYDFEKWDRSWGMYYFGKSFVIYWGEKSWHFRMPWDWEMVRHEVLFPDGTMNKPPGESWETSDGRLLKKFTYKYQLKSGEVQERTASVYVEEREWRWRCCKWLSWPNLKCRTICVDFDKEVGEGTGSWKGGTVGCGYDMKKGESIEQTLRRMEKEREFKR
jgi:hypothetical protein